MSDIPREEKIFFFLRDPVSRFVSGFYSRQHRGRPRYNSEWSERERDLFKNFSTPDQMIKALLRKQPGKHEPAWEALKHIGHFRSLKSWYGDLDYFRSRLDDLLFIGFQESLESDFPRLLTKLGFPEQIELPTDDVLAHRNPQGLDKSLHPECEAFLREWYTQDYEFINLCRAITRDKMKQDSTTEAVTQ